MTTTRHAELEARTSTLEVKTQALRVDLTTLGDKVDQNHKDTTTRLEEMSRVLTEIRSNMATWQVTPRRKNEPPDHVPPKALDRGQQPMADAPVTVSAETSSNAHGGHPVPEDLLKENSLNRRNGWAQGQVRHPAERPTHTDPYLGEALNGGLWHNEVYRPRPIRVFDPGY
ncbi:unnamed protein product [Rhodiola kirilowii]